MRKRLLMLIILLMLFIPTVVLAEGYDHIKVRGIFTTSADVSGIDKIYVQFNTRAGMITAKKDVYLTKNDNFTTVINLPDLIEDVDFIYGYCITVDGVTDKYGFLPITANKNYNEEDKQLELVLSVDYNNMGFDGKKYRANSDVTDEEYQERKSGKQVDTSLDTDVRYSPDQLDPEATAPELDSDGNAIVPTTTIISDPDKNTKKSDRVEDTKTYKILLIIAAVIGIVIAVVTVILIVKMNQANKKV